MVTFLLARGANPSLFDAQGYNALHLAAHAGHNFMLAYLVAAGMAVDGPDSMGRTALMWTAYQGNSIESAKELISLGAGLHVVDSTGYTAVRLQSSAFTDIHVNHLNFSDL